MTGLLVPGPRGFDGPGSGRADYLRRLPTLRASTRTAKHVNLWSVGGGLPPGGVPLGPILGERGGATLCCDPLTWYRDLGLISNASVWVMGLNGWGKSALIKRWLAVLAGWGVIGMVLGDVKGEYRDLIAGLGGQVIGIGPGRGYLNLLDLGSAPAAAARLGQNTAAGQLLMGDARRRRQLALEGFIGVLRGSTPDDLEVDLLAVALRLLDKAWGRRKTTPLPSDLANVFSVAPEELKNAAMWRGEIIRYHDAVDHLERNVGALARGSGIAEPFSKATTTPMRTDQHTVFDLSGISGADKGMRAATQLACWAYGFGEIAVSHALSENGLGSYPGDPYRTRIFMSVLDELWNMIRMGNGLAGLVDSLGRMNRTHGIVDVKCTHSMTDNEGLSPADVAIASGMAERSGFVATAAVPPSEFPGLARIGRWADIEYDTLASWTSPPSWEASAGGIPEGVGKVGIKLRDRPMIPCKVKLMPSEIGHIGTAQKWAVPA